MNNDMLGGLLVLISYITENATFETASIEIVFLSGTLQIESLGLKRSLKFLFKYLLYPI